MKKLKTLIVAACLVMCVGLIAGCGSSSSSSTSSDVAMSYTSVEDLKADIDAGNDDVIVLDVRKADDYAAGHIAGAVSADMDAAKGGDTETGTTNMKAALSEATGSETGDGKELVLVCYSGKSYAQAGTNILSEMGADMTKVTTLEGGMEAWTAAYPDELEQ